MSCVSRIILPLALALFANGGLASDLHIERLSQSLLLPSQLRLSEAEPLPAQVRRCVRDLSSDHLRDVVGRELHSVLNAEQLLELDRFEKTDAARKLFLRGIAMIHVAAGLEPKEPPPRFTVHDEQTLDDFSRTQTGRILWNDRAMQQPEVSASIAARIEDLVDACRGLTA